MPELPEVETVIRVLREWVLNKTIKNVKVVYEPILENKTTEEFTNILKGKTITDIKRRGKYILFYLDRIVLISHLRMEGKYFLAHYPNKNVNTGETYTESNKYIYKHTHVIFEMTDDNLLLYHDVRKFGKFFLTDVDHLDESPLGKLGKEPFEVDDPNYLYEKIKDSNSTIKEILLDQTILLGIGNIYADEIAFASNLSPFRKANTLSIEDCKNIIESAKVILAKAIELGGSSVHSFSSGNHVDGKFQEELQVYGREDKPCNKCGCKIVKMKLGGRGTCFCPSCQGNVSKIPLQIGITGLIGSGKSTVAKMISEHGYNLIDADQIAHDCYKSTSPCFEQIVQLFGEDILVNGEIDRNIIRSRLTKDNKDELERIIHPVVIKQIKSQIKDGRKYILDVPLLFETKLNKVCDFIIFVTNSYKERAIRLLGRGQDIRNYSSLNNDEEEVSKKIKMSNYVIDNSSTKEATYQQVLKLIHKIEDLK